MYYHIRHNVTLHNTPPACAIPNARTSEVSQKNHLDVVDFNLGDLCDGKSKADVVDSSSVDEHDAITVGVAIVTRALEIGAFTCMTGPILRASWSTSSSTRIREEPQFSKSCNYGFLLMRP